MHSLIQETIHRCVSADAQITNICELPLPRRSYSGARMQLLAVETVTGKGTPRSVALLVAERYVGFKYLAFVMSQWADRDLPGSKVRDQMNNLVQMALNGLSDRATEVAPTFAKSAFAD